MDNEELKVGTYVEMEHKVDMKQSAIIAKQHLEENPKYYSKLFHAGLIDEPKALKLATKYFSDVNEWLHTEVKNILKEYEWGTADNYEFGQSTGFWEKQLAGESVEDEAVSGTVVCDNCGWSWELSDGGKDPYDCHKCNSKNNKVKNESETKTN